MLIIRTLSRQLKLEGNAKHAPRRGRRDLTRSHPIIIEHQRAALVREALDNVMRQRGRDENINTPDNMIRLDSGLRETEGAGIQHLQLIRGVRLQP
jgi:hypothetical protein